MNSFAERIKLVRDHFYSVNISRADFCREFYQTYGFNTISRMERFMHKNDITVKERGELSLKNYKSTKSEIKNFNTDEINNFGIQKSIGKEYESYVLPSHCKRIGILSDIHVPFHSVDALVCAIKYLKEKEIDTLYLNGDVFDFYSISRHEKEKDLRDFTREVDMCRNFLQNIRDIFPNTFLIYKMGNHEDRFARSLMVQAEEFAQLHDLQFHIFFHLDRIGFNLVESWQGCQMADLLVLHGHELYGGGGVNPSQNTFNKTLCNTLIGHVHKTSVTTKKTGFKQFIHSYSTGCLTQLSPKYMPFSQHNHGFAFVEIKDEKAHVENIFIKNGQII